MSWIRSTQNSEKLYIYERTSGIYLRWPSADGTGFNKVTLSPESWNELLDEIIKLEGDIDDILVVDGVSVRTHPSGVWKYVFVFHDDNDMALEIWDVTLEYLMQRRIQNRRKNNFFYRLLYGIYGY